LIGHRILTGLLGGLFLLFFGYLGGVPWLLVVTLIMLLGILEFYTLGGQEQLLQKLLGFTGVLLLAYVSYRFGEAWLWPVLLLIVLLGLLFLIGNFPRWSLTELAVTYLGIIYIGGLASYLIILRQHFPDGWSYLWLTLILTWAVDTGAYFTGKAWGKHFLCPQLSPGKTWEGSLGGIFAGVLVAGIAGKFLPVWLSTWQLLVIGLITAVVGQVGDLVESAFKRQAGMKDSGKLLPGHGGILDRFDSLILIAPSLYYLLRWMDLFN
jgi:phosphatidate cytidylyltransferase